MGGDPAGLPGPPVRSGCPRYMYTLIIHKFREPYDQSRIFRGRILVWLEISKWSIWSHKTLQNPEFPHVHKMPSQIAHGTRNVARFVFPGRYGYRASMKIDFDHFGELFFLPAGFSRIPCTCVDQIGDLNLCFYEPQEFCCGTSSDLVDRPLWLGDAY